MIYLKLPKDEMISGLGQLIQIRKKKISEKILVGNNWLVKTWEFGGFERTVWIRLSKGYCVYPKVL